MTRPSLMRRAVAAWLLAALLLPAVGRAEEQPAILKAYGLDWIERVKEEAWPQPKAQRPVICLLDTGVDVTPDTPADDPNGPIVARLALDGGTGTSQGTGYPYDHGTQMASIIAAPRNGWGTVGVFPQGRIVSIRVTEGTEGFITPAAVRQGVARCARWASDEDVGLAVIVMAETNYQQRPDDTAAWTFAAERAAAVGAVFVAAIGNDEQAALVAPLAVPGVVAIAAGDSSGSLCAFSPSLTEGALVGPGCTGGPKWPDGSSAAAASVGALTAAVSSRWVELSAAQRALWLREHAVRGRQIDASGAEQLFPVAPIPAVQVPVPGVSRVADGVAEIDDTDVRLLRPKVEADFRNGRLRLRFANLHSAGMVHVTVRPGVTLSIKAKRVVVVPLKRAPRALGIWLSGSKPSPWRSLTRRVRVGAA